MPSLDLLKLQYEILNITPENLAAEYNIPESLLLETIEDNNWRHWWPESESPFTLEHDDSSIEKDATERLVMETDQYIDVAKRRLAVYNLAKSIYLAQKYLKLESALIDKAYDTIENASSLSTAELKDTASIYKDLLQKSSMASLNSFSLDEDEGGLPLVVVKNLSGRS